eukprot:gnl/TRDRNA2_/TRDRNA2_147068_c0_seq1.p1 gnl/TRDRNA2_/TRDRNA2_147068_c0~~gnl/TRDRNA2_/TRDRNA2_147068_c0_seq1.p1  ORF type:complete len:120 (-),score=5.66 gnl/TRDRNA2_/TRDRNA2_147068_c0_seq1:33-392(-)
MTYRWDIEGTSMLHRRHVDEIQMKCRCTSDKFAAKNEMSRGASNLRSQRLARLIHHKRVSAATFELQLEKPLISENQALRFLSLQPGYTIRSASRFSPSQPSYNLAQPPNNRQCDRWSI